MSRFANPHAADGHLPGAVHASCPKAGITWQCVTCDHVHTYPWREVDAYAHDMLEAYEILDSVPLPPCPQCGARPWINNADIVRGLDDPHHYTQRALDEHLLARPRLRGRFAVNEASLTDPKYQGTDFSHLPENERPDCHVPPEE